MLFRNPEELLHSIEEHVLKNTIREILEIMKESGGKNLMEESVNKNKFISKTSNKEEAEKEDDGAGLQQEMQSWTSNHGWSCQEKSQVEFQALAGPAWQYVRSSLPCWLMGH